MIAQIATLCCLVAVASAIAVNPYGPHYGAPAYVKAVAPAYVKGVEYDAPAHYDFSYAVHDEHTGDIKTQQESRKGDAVQGSYSLIDSDGFQRVVHYTADPHNGFQAHVERQPTSVKIPVPVAKVVKYAPGPIYHAPAPVYHAPAPVYHAPAPVAHYATPAHYAYSPLAKVAVAPVAKVLAPAHGYAANHVSFTGPAINYHY